MTMSMVRDIIVDAFTYALRMHGIAFLALSTKTIKYILTGYKSSSREVLHRIAIALLLNKLKICAKKSKGVLAGFYKGIYILYPAKDTYWSDATVVRSDEYCSQDLSNRLLALFMDIVPKIPIFMIDLSLWELHHEKEKLKLLKQIEVSINVIRRWLTDYHLVFVSAPSEALARLRKRILFLCPWYIDSSPYSSIDRSQTLMLDPYAEETLSTEDVFRFNYFVIGGIVDRLYSRPYATYMIYRLHLLDVERKAIKLKGSSIGVPSEINKIIDLILSIKLGDKQMDEAIIDCMGIDDKISRIVYELTKVYRDRRDIGYSDIVEYMKLYRLSEHYLKKVLAKIRKGNYVGGNT
ncbi:MAG: hypothetical protein QW111_04390 [Ignisphaera sp.]